MRRLFGIFRRDKRPNPDLVGVAVKRVERPARIRTRAERTDRTRELQREAHRRFAKAHPEWNREYRRIYQRKLRGTVTQEQWDAWRLDPRGSAGSPFSFTPFDEWVRL